MDLLDPPYSIQVKTIQQRESFRTTSTLLGLPGRNNCFPPDRKEQNCLGWCTGNQGESCKMRNCHLNCCCGTSMKTATYYKCSGRAENDGGFDPSGSVVSRNSFRFNLCIVVRVSHPGLKALLYTICSFVYILQNAKA
ncbi:hypothetical protein E2986_12966 [Frieseomelitta varia]|uniref:Uncharacterized protein n=1 Tax=Frieseomelitta varia TaxID=561572 RepID=A0A833S2Q3_9HYME|nr:hypothetical protein E2986_12966 [Frieseomelitta varia]